MVRAVPNNFTRISSDDSVLGSKPKLRHSVWQETGNKPMDTSDIKSGFSGKPSQGSLLERVVNSGGRVNIPQLKEAVPLGPEVVAALAKSDLVLAEANRVIAECLRHQVLSNKKSQPYVIGEGVIIPEGFFIRPCAIIPRTPVAESSLFGSIAHGMHSTFVKPFQNLF